MTPEEIAEARRLYEAATADIPPLSSDEEIDRRVHERTVAERTFMMRMAPALLTDLEQARRGGKELGKTVEFLAELIKAAYVQGADDPIGALHMLGNHLAEVPASEGGLHFDDFSRVYRALEERRKAESGADRVVKLHSPFKIYQPCGHEHEETDKGVTNVIDVGPVCQDGFMYTVCRHCCTDAEGHQTEECVSAHDHSTNICETRRVLAGAEVTV